MKSTFSELVEYNIGGGWGTEEVDSDSSSVGYVIRGTDIPRVAIGDVSTVPLRFHKASNLASRVLQSGDIVFEVSGGSKDQPVGRALQITDKVLAQFANPVMCASFCKLVRIDADAALPGFVFRVLQTAYKDGRLDTYQVQSTGITNFKWKPFLEHFEIELPERDVQKRVADALDAFDDLIENNRRRVEVLEEMALALYREWFIRFRYPGHASVPLVDSELGPIPQDWEVQSVAELTSDLTRGIAPKYAEDGGWTVLNQKCIRNGRVSLGPSRRQSREVPPAKRVRYGDVLINSTGVGTLGRVAQYRGNEVNLTVDSHVTVVRPRETAFNPWFGQALLDKKSDFERLGTGATGQTELGRKDIGAVLLATPPPELLTRCADAIWPFHMKADALLSESSLLASIRDLLLPKLVAGQIDVSVLSLDGLLQGAVA